MSSVTVPGTGGSIITITTNGTATHLIAQQIANALAAAGSRAVTTTGSGGPLPPTTPGATNELVITGGGGTNNVTGFPFVTNNNTSPNTISGLNTAILSGTVGGSFWVDGNSTVAAGGGNNLIIGGPGGNYQLAAGDGNDTIYTSGGGTIAGGGGANFLWAADPTDPLPNYIISDGIGDTVAAGVGPDTVVAYGSNDLIFGGTGTLVVGAAPNSTVVSGTGAETIFGASGSLVQGDGSAGILLSAGRAVRQSSAARLRSPPSLVARALPSPSRTTARQAPSCLPMPETRHFPPPSRPPTTASPAAPATPACWVAPATTCSGRVPAPIR